MIDTREGFALTIGDRTYLDVKLVAADEVAGKMWDRPDGWDLQRSWETAPVIEKSKVWCVQHGRVARLAVRERPGCLRHAVCTACHLAVGVTRDAPLRHQNMILP